MGTLELDKEQRRVRARRAKEDFLEWLAERLVDHSVDSTLNGEHNWLPSLESMWIKGAYVFVDEEVQDLWTHWCLIHEVAHLKNEPTYKLDLLYGFGVVQPNWIGALTSVI